MARFTIVKMGISIVVPVLNESRLIREFLRHLRERADGAEIIVVDGGSSDGTTEFAAGLCDQLVRSGPGRARQMNAGAAVAHGDVLWFLHVDAEIPHGALEEIQGALQDPPVVGGFFRIRIPRKNPVYRFTDSFAHYAGLALRMRFGDHGIFCRRDVFNYLGGYPEVDLMEDADFFSKLRRCGKIAILGAPIVVSPRRFEEIGPLRLTMAYGLIATLYFFGVPRRRLQSIYLRTCCQRGYLG